MKVMAVLFGALLIYFAPSGVSASYPATLTFDDGSSVEVRAKLPKAYFLIFQNEPMQISVSDIRSLEVVSVDYTRSSTDRSPSGLRPEHEFRITLNSGRSELVKGRLCNLSATTSNQLTGGLEERRYYFYRVRNHRGNHCVYDRDNAYKPRRIVRVDYH